jgi:hypothetical protein
VRLLADGRHNKGYASNRGKDVEQQARSDAAKRTLDSTWATTGGLLVVGCAIGLAFLNSPGTGDRAAWLDYMGFAREHSLRATAIYGIDDSKYPPLGVVTLGLVGRFGSLLGWADLVALKVSLLLATLASAWFITAWNARWQPLLGAAMFGALFANSMLLSYIDAYFVVVLLLALLCLQRGFLATGTALYTVSVFVKWQPMLLAPFLLLYLLREPQRMTLVAAGRIFAPAALVVAVIYLLFGNMVIAAFWRQITDPTFSSFSGSALNLNWLITAAMQLSTGELQKDGGIVDTIWGGGSTLGYISYALRIVTFLTTVAYFYYSKRQFADLLQAAIIGYLCYFMFGFGVHENHGLIAAVLALCLVGTTGAGQVQAIVLAAMVNVNLLLFFGLTGTKPDLSRVVFGWDVSIYLSLLNLAIFAVLWTPAAAAVWPRVAGKWRAPTRSYSFDKGAMS